MFLLKKKFNEMEREISDLKQKNSELNEKNQELKNQIKGGRVTGDWCNTCGNSFKIKNDTLYGAYYTYGCLLDVKCKNYERMEEKQ